ncbi:hypothetical protein KV097_08245 [Mumia sp. zg.B17]|uniref:hypothetical protein n=1 Tax=Mumia sp. zg.B17 TaxID=2855446 RepID=UPI001C6DF9A8|nr:hypothetical protein [Mumia sp. zg.B17]MBW9205935.1 hypothetical protein [Mumia sp. zg.B17]
MSAPYLRDLVADTSYEAPAAHGLRERVKAYAARRSTAEDHGDVLGPLVVPDTELPLVQGTVAALGADEIDVVVAVTGGAGAIEPAVRWATRQERLRLVGLTAAVRDLDDLARGAHRVVAMVGQLEAEGLLEDVDVQVGLPLHARTEGSLRWQHALDTLASQDLRLVLRTGGADPEEVPSAETLAGAVGDALDREVAFSCRGDLAHAVAWREPDTGRVRHGFLNVLLATRASLDGGDVGAVAERLALTASERVVTELGVIGESSLESARRWFTGVGSEDVDASLADLRALSLLGPTN